MRISKSQLRKLVREEIGVEHYFNLATKSLAEDRYFGSLVESACTGTECLFGAKVPDYHAAELWVAKRLSRSLEGGPLVFAYGSRSKKLPEGFSAVRGVPGLFIPTDRCHDLNKLTRQGVKDLNKLINHHKPDVLIWDNGLIREVEVKHTKRKTFNRIPSACRTDYDYYVLISENKTFLLSGDDYRKIAKNRLHRIEKNIDFTKIKSTAENSNHLYDNIKNTISNFGEEKLSETLVNAIMHRLVPQGKRNQMTMPFLIDGHKVRLDLKLENKNNVKSIIKEDSVKATHPLEVPTWPTEHFAWRDVAFTKDGEVRYILDVNDPETVEAWETSLYTGMSVPVDANVLYIKGAYPNAEQVWIHEDDLLALIKTEGWYEKDPPQGAEKGFWDGKGEWQEEPKPLPYKIDDPLPPELPLPEGKKMKITKNQLRQLIKEEVRGSLKENAISIRDVDDDSRTMVHARWDPDASFIRLRFGSSYGIALNPDDAKTLANLIVEAIPKDTHPSDVEIVSDEETLRLTTPTRVPKTWER